MSRRGSEERQRDQVVSDLRSELRIRDEALRDQARQFEDYREQAEVAFARRSAELERASSEIEALSGSNGQLRNMVQALGARLDTLEEKGQTANGSNVHLDDVFGRFEQSISNIASARPMENARASRRTMPRINMDFAVFNPDTDSYRTWLQRLYAKLDILDVKREDSLLWIENLLPNELKGEFWSLVEIGSTIAQINEHFARIYGGKTKAQLMKDFENLQQKPSERTISFYQRWRATVTELRNFGIELSDSYLVEYCMSKLSYEKEVRKEEPQDTDEAFRLAIRLEEVYGLKTKGTVNVATRSKVTCFHCGKEGHKKFQCWKLKRDRSNGSNRRDRRSFKDDRRKHRDDRRDRGHRNGRETRNYRKTNKTVNALAANPRKLPAIYIQMEGTALGAYRMEAVIDTGAEVGAIINTRLLDRVNHAVKNADPQNVEITSGDGQAFEVRSVVLLKTMSGTQFEAYAVENFAFEALLGMELIEDADIRLGESVRIPAFQNKRFDLHNVKKFYLPGRSVNTSIYDNEGWSSNKFKRSDYGPWKTRRSDYGRWSRELRSASAAVETGTNSAHNYSNHEPQHELKDYNDMEEVEDIDFIDYDEYLRHEEVTLVNAVNAWQHRTLLQGVQSDELATLVEGIDKVHTDEEQHQDEKMAARFEAQYPELFSDFERGHMANVEPIHLELKSDVERVFVPPRRLAKAEEEIAYNEIANMERLGIIRRSYSASNCPILVVKQGTKYRVCFDFRKLNRSLMDMDFPIPRIRDLLEALQGAKHFTTLDLARGFHQLPIAEDSTHLLAFTANNQKYEFVRLPFGLKIAPMAFQKCVSQVLGEDLWISCLLYIDDVLIFTKGDIRQHEEAVNRVLSNLCRAGMKLRKRKCIFGVQRIGYLGYTITTQGITPRSSYLEKLKRCPPPEDKSQLRSFLGLIPFLSAFSAEVNTITQPLRALLKKNVNFEWSQECHEAFDQVRRHFDNKMIRHYDSAAPHEIFVDSSQYATGGYLLQHGNIVLCTSISFPPSVQLSYSATERELLGIVLVVRKMDRFLFGREFKVYTDHRPLLQIFTKKNFASRRIARLVLRLQEYVFTTEYIPGRDHLLADHLSRVKLLTTSLLTKTDAYAAFIKAHSEKHYGVQKTLKRLRGVSWHGKRKDIKAWINGCRCAHQKENRRNTVETRASLDLGRYPYNVIAIDLYSYNSATFMTVLDMYSDFLWILRCDGKSMEAVEKVWLEWMSKQSERPREVLSDRGGEFNFMEKYDEILHRRTASYRPQSNGRLERRHKEIAKLCRIRSCMPDELNDMNSEEARLLLAEEIPEIHKFAVDDEVLRYVNRRARHKHHKVWTGPWKIRKIIGEHTVMLDSGSIVNVNDLKIRRGGSKVCDFYLNMDYVDEAFTFWKVKELEIEDVFREQKEPWSYNWERRFILISLYDYNLQDVLVKCVHEPCVLIIHLKDVYNDDMRVLGTLEADWIELPDRTDLFIDAEGKLEKDDGVTRWFIWIDEREFDIVADNWGGNVETWLSYAARVDHRSQVSEQDIFDAKDDCADEYSPGEDVVYSRREHSPGL